MLVQGDVSREEDIRRIFREVLDAWGRLDIRVNNADIQAESPTHETAMDDYDRVLAVNLRGAFLCAREAVRHFLERGGIILNNTSVHEAAYIIRQTLDVDSGQTLYPDFRTPWSSGS